MKEKEKPKVIPVIDKNARRIYTLEDAKLMAKTKVGAKDAGWIQGYAAVWNNVDLQGEIMRKGAFATTIQERVSAGKVKLMVKHFAHGGDVLECIGTITEMKEDDFGLWFHADLSSVQMAQDVRTKVQEGHLNRASVGYGPVHWDFIDIDGRTVLEHLECKVFEVTITVIPANEMAELTAVKSFDLASEKLKEFSDKLTTMSKSDAITEEERVSILEEVFGGKDKAVELSKSLDDLSLQVKAFLENSEPEAAKVVDLSQIENVIRNSRLELAKLAIP